jgi:hypothetical protein
MLCLLRREWSAVSHDRGRRRGGQPNAGSPQQTIRDLTLLSGRRSVSDVVRGSILPHVGLAGRQRRLLAAALLDLAALLLFQAPQRAALVRVRVFDQAVDLASLVVLWQVLGNRKTFRIAEE